MDLRRASALILAAALLSACAAPQVKLYPDERFKSIPKETVDTDIKECDDRAKEFVQTNKGKIVAKRAGGGAVPLHLHAGDSDGGRGVDAMGASV